ncbi:hypothetical protein [Streptomyces sp. CB01881]|uniref:hypothetical protein n=1 Tax=Streptomyces sp. CB01881 TaxID=2078691 RepID=UPI000CDC11B2|nr:hypothetical protein [Streptomyces sp. CB01881]AUY51464.1 hypothetical protein C2142_23865 [Streptomyces sp. CB01881]TYC74857.1 hypothetical protein EH183_23855 [Streptomyces sp. CB01881]
MNTRQDELRRDLDATLQARKELGKEYEPELVDSFLTRLESRLDARLDARVERRVAERLDDYGPAEHLRRRSGRSGTRLPMASLVLGIPLTAIATNGGSNGFTGLLGLVVCWTGIVGVNVAAALGNRREDRRPKQPRSEWD